MAGFRGGYRRRAGHDRRSLELAAIRAVLLAAALLAGAAWVWVDHSGWQLVFLAHS